MSSAKPLQMQLIGPVAGYMHRCIARRLAGPTKPAKQLPSPATTTWKLAFTY